jgi:hypothetical protein
VLYLHTGDSFSRFLQSLSWSRNSPSFMRAEDSVPRSQEFITELVESSPHPHTLFHQYPSLPKFLNRYPILSGFASKVSCSCVISPIDATCLAHLTFVNFIILLYFEKNKYYEASRCVNLSIFLVRDILILRTVLY